MKSKSNILVKLGMVNKKTKGMQGFDGSGNLIAYNELPTRLHGTALMRIKYSIDRSRSGRYSCRIADIHLERKYEMKNSTLKKCTQFVLSKVELLSKKWRRA